MPELLTLFAIVFAINLMPAFGPPSWSIIALFGLSTGLPLPAIVATGALAAASGRLALAHGFRFWGDHVSEKTRANLRAAKSAFERRRHSGILALGLFALSPLPSAQLFAAAGLTGMRLVPFTLAFFAGRIVSYTIYATTARIAGESSLADTFRDSFTSPLGVALQLAMLAGLVLLFRIDWARLLGDDGSSSEETDKE